MLQAHPEKVSLDDLIEGRASHPFLGVEIAVVTSSVIIIYLQDIETSIRETNATGGITLGHEKLSII
jgi:hypothetical protein